MSYHPRIESEEMASFLTARSRNSELWFVNNAHLEGAVLGYAAKYAKVYGVQLYALAVEGNHIQGPALFPRGNRANFMRDFSACVARAVTRHTPEYPGGKFWGRRYSAEFLPGPEDIEEYFFYTVLQPVKDGLVENLSDYPGYNCFHDAVWGIKRIFKVVNWSKYNALKRYSPNLRVEDFIEKVSLEYQRLPGYEHLSQKQYARLMNKKLESRRKKLVAERYNHGKGFVGRRKLLLTKRGARPKSTKTSTLTSHRPRVLSVCNQRRAECKAWYFDIYFSYKEASKEYRAGNLTVKFPEGTYRPWSKPLPDT